MKLYYSVVSQQGQIQENPKSSLGGFCSSTLVPSNVLNNVFSSILVQSKDELQLPLYSLLILKNTFNVASTGIELFISKGANSSSNYRVAIVEPSSEGEFEVIQTQNSKPYYAEFDTVDGQEDSISLPDLEPEEIIGIWIERVIDTQSELIKNLQSPEFLFENKGEVVDKENAQLKISWTN